MSIYIKGMEMPDRCAGCWLMDGEDSWCTAMMGKPLTSDFRYGIKDKPEWCPLIEFPPHGRLIDADALIKRISELVRKAETDGFDLGAAWYKAFIRHIELAPTIVPADKEG